MLLNMNISFYKKGWCPEISKHLKYPLKAIENTERFCMISLHVAVSGLTITEIKHLATYSQDACS